MDNEQVTIPPADQPAVDQATVDQPSANQPAADQPAGSQASSAEAWSEVGREFEEFGGSLAAAVRTVWTSEESQRHLKAVQEGLSEVADELSQAVKQTAASPEAHQVREQAHKAAVAARFAGEKALEEARPHLLAALRQLNVGLEKVITKMEASETPADEEPDTSSPEEAPAESVPSTEGTS
jgi:hypothetical protein